MKKVSIQEAIKANEHSRVRLSLHTVTMWYDVRAFNRCSNIPIEYILADWEIEEKPLEIWVNVYPEGVGRVVQKTKEEADFNKYGNRIRCVKMREVTDD